MIAFCFDCNLSILLQNENGNLISSATIIAWFKSLEFISREPPTGLLFIEIFYIDSNVILNRAKSESHYIFIFSEHTMELIEARISGRIDFYFLTFYATTTKSCEHDSDFFLYDFLRSWRSRPWLQIEFRFVSSYSHEIYMKHELRAIRWIFFFLFLWAHYFFVPFSRNKNIRKLKIGLKRWNTPPALDAKSIRALATRRAAFKSKNGKTSSRHDYQMK